MDARARSALLSSHTAKKFEQGRGTRRLLLLVCWDGGWLQGRIARCRPRMSRIWAAGDMSIAVDEACFL
jgi:hypothetical protein